jgi:hypothetical protein
LLALAREMEGLGADALPSALQGLAAAYAPDGELAAAVQRAWLSSRADKTATLALAWAREQLRLGLQGSSRQRRPRPEAPSRSRRRRWPGCSSRRASRSPMNRHPPSPIGCACCSS